MLVRRILAKTLFLWCALAAAHCAAADRPNVLFVAVDDLRDWVGFLGGYEGDVYTPAMDRLAARGVAFTNAHTASPVCCPSRAAVMSGKLPSTTGVYNNQHWWKPHRPELITIPIHFRRHGYAAIGAGKIFHHTAGNNPPGQWDAYHRNRFTDNAWAYQQPRQRALYPFTPRMATPEGFPFSGITLYSMEVDWGVLSKPESEYDDVMTVDYAIRYLKERTADDKPFFLACGLFHPHLPWYVPQSYLDRYPDASLHLPPELENDLDDVPEAGRRLAARKREDLKRLRDSGKWRIGVRHYLASITFSDSQIGRLLDALDASGHADDTIVVLWSDHGWHFGEKQHWHKRTLWEVATRVPLVIATPGPAQLGARCGQPVSLVDIFPTLTELCRLPDVDGMDGRSLAPLLKNPDASRSHPAVTVDENLHVSIRDLRWRYIRYQDGGEELYDLQADPHEWRNLAAVSEFAPEKRRLAAYAPKTFAEAARKKNAYDFEPHAYRWRIKATGRIVEGGNSKLE